MMKSIWSLTANAAPLRAQLSEDLRVDAAVIGGGMAGLLTAYLLQCRGVRCAVLEAGRVGCGQTGGSTGKLTSQHGMLYTGLVEQLGVEKARMYAHANQQAVGQYRTMIEQLAIPCDFEACDAYLYALSDAGKAQKEAKVAAALGLPASFVESVPLPFDTLGAVRFANQAQFHPLKFLYALSERVRVFEHSRVMHLEHDRLQVNGHTVQADFVVFATHYPFINIPGYYFARMYQSRAYSLAVENAGPLDGVFIGMTEDALSLRAYRNMLILCGSDHRAGENALGGRYDALRQTARLLFPDSREVAHWSAQDCMTPDDVPYIGRYCASEPGWFVATGFHKWGMTGSMAAAQILCDMITGREHPNAEVFSPQRFNRPTLSGVLSAGSAALKGLSRQNLTVPEETLAALPAGHGGIVSVADQKMGVYKDLYGQVYLVDTRCPHLGCQVEWNPDERSWDCPCHGSRFDHLGRLIDNPAQASLTCREASGQTDQSVLDGTKKSSCVSPTSSMA